MTGKEIMTTYPKSINLIKKWYTKKMEEHFQGETQDFFDYMKNTGVPDGLIISAIEGNPSTIFKIFDEIGVYVETKIIIKATSISFTYDLFSDGVFPVPSAPIFLKRNDADFYGMLSAMQYIEENYEGQNSGTSSGETTE